MAGLYSGYIHFVHLLAGKSLRVICTSHLQAIISLHHLHDSLGLLLGICWVDCGGSWRPHELVRHHSFKRGREHCRWSCLREEVGNRPNMYWKWYQFCAEIETKIKSSPVDAVDLVSRYGSWLVSGVDAVPDYMRCTPKGCVSRVWATDNLGNDFPTSNSIM